MKRSSIFISYISFRSVRSKVLMQWICFHIFGEIMFEFMLCWVLLSYVTNECSHFFPLYFLLISVCNIKRWTSLCLSRRLRTRFSDFCSNNYNIHILERKKKIRNQIYFIFFLILNNNFKKEEIEHWCLV